MRIPLLYRGEYSQWVERFINYLEEQTDGEAMVNSIKNGDQPLPRVTQVSIAGTTSTEQPHLKDKFMWQNQRDVNDVMGSEKKTVVVTSDPLALIAEKTIVEKKDDEKKRDMSRVKRYNCKKEGHFTKDYKKAKVKDYEYYKTKMLLAKKDKDEQVLLAEDQAWMESSSDSDQEMNANMTKMMLAKKDKDEQVLLAKDQAWMESSSDLDQEINANMVFMAQIEKVLSDSEASSSSADEKISE
nr:hypothetical protein [Tanacetum cinerariifolium]